MLDGARCAIYRIMSGTGEAIQCIVIAPGLQKCVSGCARFGADGVLAPCSSSPLVAEEEAAAAYLPLSALAAVLFAGRFHRCDDGSFAT